MNQIGATGSKPMDLLDEALDDITAVLRLPLRYPKRLRTTNGIEGSTVRRRERVIRIFPNEASAVRFIGALLIEQDDKWLTGWKYFEMDTYYHSISAQEESDEQMLESPLIPRSS